MSDPAAAVQRLLGVRPEAVRPLGGAWRVTLQGGRHVVTKRGDRGQPASEAAGLDWLRDPAGPPVPAVLGLDDTWLVIEDVGSAAGSAAAARSFGRALAALHARGADAFGTPPPGTGPDAWIGTAPLRNVAGPAWPGWYVEHRVLPYLRTAVDQDSIAGADRDAVEQVCARIDEIAGPPEPPARLHGDLWYGNVHCGSDGRYWLLDPAAHGGHRETDLAMLALFGAPGLEAVLGGYEEAWPLADGWQSRIPLHQLFPLLVHAVLFGGGYGSQAGRAARAALR